MQYISVIYQNVRLHFRTILSQQRWFYPQQCRGVIFHRKSACSCESTRSNVIQVSSNVTKRSGELPKRAFKIVDEFEISE